VILRVSGTCHHRSLDHGCDGGAHSAHQASRGRGVISDQHVQGDRLKMPNQGGNWQASASGPLAALAPVNPPLPFVASPFITTCCYRCCCYRHCPVHRERGGGKAVDDCCLRAASETALTDPRLADDRTNQWFRHWVLGSGATGVGLKTKPPSRNQAPVSSSIGTATSFGSSATDRFH